MDKVIQHVEDKPEEFEIKTICSKAGRKAMDDRAGTVINMSDETPNRVSCGDIGSEY
jgi:hypothetical protein